MLRVVVLGIPPSSSASIDWIVYIYCIVYPIINISNYNVKGSSTSHSSLILCQYRLNSFRDCSSVCDNKSVSLTEVSNT